MKRTRAILKIIAILAILAQVFATMAHNTGEAACAEIPDGCSMTANDLDLRPQRSVPTDWHCHGCFSASMPVPPIVLARLQLALSAWPPLDGFRTGLRAGVDPPPPRQVA